MALFRLERFLVIALLLTCAAVAVSAEAATDDVDREDFSDPALSEDVVLEAQGPHSDIEPASILPECPDGKVPVGGTSDLLVAMANGGSKMFNMSHIVAKLLAKDGTVYKDLGRYEYGQPIGPHEQRSFRYPLELEPEAALGEYTLVATAYYNDKAKSPFFNVVCNETTVLVPALPTPTSPAQLLQLALGVVAVGMLLLIGSRAASGGEKGSKPKEAKKAGAAPSGRSEGGAAPENIWLSGTLAGAENRSPKKAKKK